MSLRAQARQPVEAETDPKRAAIQRILAEERVAFTSRAPVYRHQIVAQWKRLTDRLMAEVVGPDHDERAEGRRAEFERVMEFLDERGVWLRYSSGHRNENIRGDVIYHGGHSIEALEDAYAEEGRDDG